MIVPTHQESIKRWEDVNNSNKIKDDVSCAQVFKNLLYTT